MANKPRPDLARDELLQRLTALIYGEAANQPNDVKSAVGSTVFNRVDSPRDKEFGKDLDSVIINRASPYYSYRDPETRALRPSKRTAEALGNNFIKGTSAHKAYEASAQIAQNLFDRKIPRSKGEFFFKKNEANSLKKKLLKVGSSGPYEMFSYPIERKRK